MAILSVLLALILPSVFRAREAAIATADLSQLSQINKAFLMYVSDNDGRYPAAYEKPSQGESIESTGVPGKVAQYTWVLRVYPYVKSTEAFWSPVSRDCKIEGVSWKDKKRDDFAYIFSYLPSWGYNAQYFSPHAGNKQKFALNPSFALAPIHESKVQDPSATLMLGSSTCADVIGFTKGVNNVGFYRIAPPSLTSYWKSSNSKKESAHVYGHLWPRFRSGKAVNAAFPDGHVKTLPINDFKDEQIWQVQKGVSWKDQ